MHSADRDHLLQHNLKTEELDKQQSRYYIAHTLSNVERSCGTILRNGIGGPGADPIPIPI